MPLLSFGAARDGVLGIGEPTAPTKLDSDSAVVAALAATSVGERINGKATGAGGAAGAGGGPTTKDGKPARRPRPQTNAADALRPVLAEAFQGKRITGVSAGEAHAVAVSAFGDVMAWGRGFEGQLGTGDRRKRDEPVDISAQLGYQKVAVAEAGSRHSVAVTESGRVYQWGELHRNTGENPVFGFRVRQVGLADEEEDPKQQQEQVQRDHRGMRTGRDAPAAALAAVGGGGGGGGGGRPTGAEMAEESSRAYLAGGLTEEQAAVNNFGGFASYFQTVPAQVEGPLLRRRVVAASAGYAFTTVVTDAGHAYAWGFNEKGQLGLGHRYNQEQPQLIASLAERGTAGLIEKVACGQQHQLLLTTNGDVYSCGLGVFGQLGHGRLRDELFPRAIRAFARPQIIEAGPDEILRGQDGELLTSDEAAGAAGGASSSSSVAAAAAGATTTTSAEEDASASAAAAAAIASDDDDDDDVGGTASEGGRIRVVDLACGTFYSMCVAADGQCYAFGHSEYGQHGGSEAQWSDWATGTREDTSAAGGATSSRDQSKLKDMFHAIPRPVVGLEGERVRSVTCGNLHTIAVTEDDKLYTWGWGSSGCLGHGNRRMALVPTVVEALQGEERIVSVAAGWKHTTVVTAGKQHSETLVDFKNLIDAPQYADVYFEVDGARAGAPTVRVAGHRAIVFSRCPRIRQMLLLDARFSHRDARARDYTLRLRGVRAPVFMQLLLFLYCDYVKAPAHIARELVPLASKLELPRLAALARAACDFRAAAERGSGIPDSTFVSDMAAAVDDQDLADVSFVLQQPKAPEVIADLDILGQSIEIVGSTATTGDDDDDEEEEEEVEETVVWANRAILAARSTYFERMFGGDFKEADQLRFVVGVDGHVAAAQQQQESPVSSKDGKLEEGSMQTAGDADGGVVGDDGVDPSAFVNLLKFMYTADESIVHADNAVDMLEVADRFVVDDLKQILEAFIAPSISLDTAPYILAAADRFHAWRLKRCAVDYLEHKAVHAALRTSEGLAAAKAAGDLKPSVTTPAQELVRRLCASDGFDQLTPPILREIDFLCAKAGSTQAGEVMRAAARATTTATAS